MKTNELIKLLAADHAVPAPDLRMRLLVGVLGGALLSVTVLIMHYGIRPNLADMMLSWRVAAKFVVALALVAGAATLSLRLASPLARRSHVWLLLLPAPLLLVAACLGEMATLPAASWWQAAVGHYSVACLISVPLLSAGPLAGAIWALREGAPARPAGLGAAAGAMAAGLGAAIYALHCPDDSPLFLALWYTMSTGAIVLAARGAGACLLRW